jgi:uncharacterized repeat protein (TIGR01451 family)
LTATTMSGSGWNCTLGTLTCTRSDVLAAHNSYPAITLTVKVATDAPGVVTNTVTVSGGGDQNPSNNTANDQTTIIQTGPDPSITKTHSGSFTGGQSGTYTITVTNVGLTTTSGMVSVTDTPPTGLTANTVVGSGWACVLGPPVSCTRSDALASNASYPPITLAVIVADDAPASVINTATVSGGGDVNPLNNTAQDKTTIIDLPDLAITKSHTGTFSVGQTGATYTITVSNVGAIATSGGTLGVNDFLPSDLSATAASGTGWTCTLFPSNFVNCNRPAGTLASGNSYPPITLTVNVSPNPQPLIINSVQLTGIGLANPSHSSASDATMIVGFGVSSANTSATVTAGSSAAFGFSANVASNAGTINFGATGLPPNSKATFNPTSVTHTGPVTLTVDTSGNGHTAALLPLGAFPQLTPYLAGVFALVAALGIAGKNRGFRRRLLLVSCIWVGALVLFFVGCGGGGGSPPPPPPVATPSGTYTITVTATSSNTSISPVNVPVTLIVK